MIETMNLTKSFDDCMAVNHVSITMNDVVEINVKLTSSSSIPKQSVCHLVFKINISNND